MGGLRKAMPFTAEADDHRRPGARRFPGTSGFFSKDEILAFAAHRGGFYLDLHDRRLHRRRCSTAFYAFRIIFRVFWGEPGARGARARAGPSRPRRAREPAHRREGGHRRRLPGRRAPHRRARVADVAGDVRPRRSCRSSAASIQIPGLDDVDRRSSSPGRSSTRRCTSAPDDRRRLGGARRRRRDLDHRDRHSRISSTCARPGTAAALIRRFRPIHTFLVNKWYFDELYDARHLPPADRRRPLRQRRRRAGRRPGDRGRRPSTSSEGSAWSCAAPSRASSAPTRCS